jgi:glycosyltransferase involved in cell wall biosynthesis
MNTNKKSGVIYTCITGGYDTLINHTFMDKNWDYVCFTDDLTIRNDNNSSWQIRPLFFDKLDNIRNQRWHKLHPHVLFPEYSKSIWLDANINILNKDIFDDIDKAIAESRLISIGPHPVRNCIYEEVVACIALGKDDERIMREQVNLIRDAGFPENNGLFENGVIYRDHHHHQVIEIMNDWWCWIENYSRRDQLSLPYVLWQHKLEIKPLTAIPYRYSEGIEFVDSANHVTKEELMVQKDKLKQALAERDDQIIKLNQELQNIKEETAKKDAFIDERDDQIASLSHVAVSYNHALRTIEELRESTSWRVTVPLRYLSSKIKNIIAVMKLLPGIIRFGGGMIGSAEKAWRVFLREGWPGVKRRILFVGGHRNDYSEWIRLYDTLTDELRAVIRDRINNFTNKPLISVIMPVYNPKPEWLVEAIESVRKQIYPYWELCIADDASTDKKIRPILERYAKEDSRIKVVFRECNGHISAASNSALELAKGEYIALLDNDDLLSEQALSCVAEAILANPDAKIIYSDEDKISVSGLRADPYFKCDWNYELFMGHNLISHLGVYQSDIVNSIGGFRVGYEGSQDYDLTARVIEQIDPLQIVHIPRILYHWRIRSGSTSMGTEEKPYAYAASEKALNEHLVRRGIRGHVKALPNGMHRLRFDLPDNLPLVSIIIPTRNTVDLLRKCVTSIFNLTTYKKFEILLIDNGSDDPVALEYFDYLKRTHSNIAVIKEEGSFNFSALNNNAVRQAKGELIALLNNDTEVITPDWLSEMASIALQRNVGAVGAKLWYPSDCLQHGGVILGLGADGVAGHMHHNIPRGNYGYFGRASLTQELSAVTAACLVVHKDKYLQVGGLNETDLAEAFNDVDFCLKLKRTGYRNIWTPYAELYHHESATRSYGDSLEKRIRRRKEVLCMKERWGDILRNDSFYNPNLALEREDFSLAWPPRFNFHY